MDFELIAPIVEIGTIAVGRSIHELPRLVRRHGKGRWRKLKGTSIARFGNGMIAEVELHWYEAHGIGRRELKIKRILKRT